MEEAVPKSTVTAVLKEYLPEHLRCAGETKDIVATLVQNFISTLAGNANAAAEGESKKTIAPSHILAALRQMGFEDMCEEVAKVGDDSKEAATVRAQSQATRKAKFSQMTEEELLAEQERFMARAQAQSQLAENLMQGQAALLDEPSSSAGALGGASSLDFDED